MRQMHSVTGVPSYSALAGLVMEDFIHSLPPHLSYSYTCLSLLHLSSLLIVNNCDIILLPTLTILMLKFFLMNNKKCVNKFKIESMMLKPTIFHNDKSLSLYFSHHQCINCVPQMLWRKLHNKLPTWFSASRLTAHIVWKLGIIFYREINPLASGVLITTI